eukprot:RCo006639
MAEYATKVDLTAPQREALERMIQLSSQAAPPMNLARWAATSGETVGDLLVRFLKARKWDAKKAFDMLAEDVKWREEMKLDELIKMEPSQIIGVEASVIEQYFPCWSQGVDRDGRPVLYKSYGGNFEIWKLTERGATVESLLRFHIYENEKNLRMLAMQPPETRASQFTIVVEAKGWRLGLATPDAMRYIKGMAELDLAHYPERLGYNFVVNAPLIFTATWGLIRSWLDPVTVAKIYIMGGESKWRPVLEQHIAPEQLAVEFGGLNRTRNPKSPMGVGVSSLAQPLQPPPRSRFAESEGENSQDLAAAD